MRRRRLFARLGVIAVLVSTMAVIGGRPTPALASSSTDRVAAAGQSFSVALANDGTVYTWGLDYSGQLGNGQSGNYIGYPITSGSPVHVQGVSSVRSVAAGNDFTHALATDGTVWGWGNNASGQLGTGGTASLYSTPQQIPSSTLSGVTGIADGDAHGLALKSDGSVWAWGKNNSGQLGNGTTTNSSTPVQVTGLTAVTAVAAGQGFSVALKSDGTVWTWGSNSSGQLGNGTSNSSTPVQVSGLTGIISIAAAPSGQQVVALKPDGTVWAWGSNWQGVLGDGTTVDRSTPVQVYRLSNVVAIAAGGSQSMALTASGTIATWGNNQQGWTGNGSGLQPDVVATVVPNLTGMTAIAAGYDHVLAVKSNGTAWTWGDGQYGGLGQGSSNASSATPLQVTSLTSVAQPPAYSAPTGSLNPPPAPNDVPSLDRVVAGGQYFSATLNANGGVSTWGLDYSGQLGNGQSGNYIGYPITSDYPTGPLGFGGVRSISAGQSFMVALKSDGTVWAWGDNSAQQLANGGTATSYSTPQLVAAGTLNGIVAVAAGDAHALALKSDGTVWAWGSNAYGQLGNGTTASTGTPVQVSGLTGVTAVSAGDRFSVALKSDGSVWTWGYNAYNQLGNGTSTYSATPGQVSGLSGISSIAASSQGDYVLALKPDGTVWAWGSNWSGELGDGTTVGRAAPVQVYRLSNVVAIATGGSRSMALTASGTVATWGNNQQGWAGNGGAMQPDVVATVVPNRTGMTGIAVGYDHFLAVKADGTAWAWGDGHDGALGQGTNESSSATPLQVAYLPSVAQPAAYTPPTGSPNPPPAPNDVPALDRVAAAGENFSVMLNADSTVSAWGMDYSGQIGIGQSGNRFGYPQTSDSPTGPLGFSGVRSIAAGTSYTLALKADGTVWAWGDNSGQQIGNGGTDTSYTTPQLVAAGTLNSIVGIAAGDTHALALKSDGTVWAWGKNTYGQLGNGTTSNSGMPAQVSGLSGATAVAAGQDFSMALKSDGTVWAWGSNSYGQLGNGTGISSTTPVQVSALTGVIAIAANFGGQHALALKPDGSVWGWGADWENQLGDSPSASYRLSPVKVYKLGHVVAISAGSSHSMALVANDTVDAWGYNYQGVLGTGSTSTPVPVATPVPGLSGITAVAGGEDHSLAVEGDGTGWAWGDGRYGALGQGNESPSSAAIPVPNLPSIAQPGAYPAPLSITVADLMGGGSPSEPCACAIHASRGDPVDTATGNFWETFIDLNVPGRGVPLAFQRTYNALAAGTSGILGYGWTPSYAMSLSVSTDASTVTVNEEGGSQVTFTLTNGAYGAPPWVLASLTRNGDGTFTFVRRARERFAFSSTGRLQSEADLNGDVTTMSYNTGGQLSTVTDAAGRTLVLGYTGANLTSVTDPLGRTVHFAYDSAGNLSDVTDVGAGNTHFTYDANHLLLTMRDPRGGTTTNHYDSSSRVDWQRDPAGRTTTFAYTGAPLSPTGGTTTVTDPKGNVIVDSYAYGERTSETRGYGTAEAATWTYSYDDSGTLAVTSVTDPNHHTTSMTWDTNGNELTVTDALGRQTVNTYDALNDVISTTDPSGVATSMTYDAAGNLLTVSRPLVGTGQSQQTTYQHGDAAHPGDVTAVVDADGEHWLYAYDASGNMIRSTDPLGDTTTHTYNAIGWETSSVVPKGNVAGCGCAAAYTSTISYNAFGQATSRTDPLSHLTLSSYDADGNLISATDPNGNTTTFTYDADNEQTDVTRPDSPPTTLHTDFNADGTVGDQKDGKGTMTLAYGYDSLGRATTATDALGHVTTFGYDGAGNRVTQQIPGGSCAATPQVGCITMGYDAANELTAITYSDGVTPNVSNITYDADGHRTAMTDGTGTSRWSYDSLHRLISTTNGAGAIVGYGYDSVGHLTGITYPGSHTVLRGFDDAGRLTSVQDWLGNTTTFGYDPDSNLTSILFPAGTGETDTSSFDAAERLTAITASQTSAPLPPATLASFSYTRDNNGQVNQETPTAPGATPHRYSYTALNQVATDNALPYAYDAADNLTRLTSGGSLAYDAADQLCWTVSAPSSNACTAPPSGATLYGYNARGDRTTITPPTGNTTTLGYDLADRLTNYNGAASYVYNGDGLRASKTVGSSTTQFTWGFAGGVPVLLQEATSAGTTSYVSGPDGLPLEQISPSGTVSFFHHDQLGSTRLLTSATGAVQATYNFDPYGNLTASTSPGGVTTPLLWAGQYRDSETGLYYLRARYYDPATAQFLSRDPLVAQTREPYGYVDGNPLNLVDPSGEEAACDIPRADCLPGYIFAAGALAVEAVVGIAANDSSLQDVAATAQQLQAVIAANDVQVLQVNNSWELKLPNGDTVIVTGGDGPLLVQGAELRQPTPIPTPPDTKIKWKLIIALLLHFAADNIHHADAAELFADDGTLGLRCS